VRLNGRIYFGPQRVLYLGPSLAVSVHRHHALQLFLPLSGAIRLRSGPGASWRGYEGAIVAPSCPHEADSPTALLATLWLEPGLEPARRLASRARGAGIAPLERAALERVAPALLRCWNEGYDAARACGLVAQVLAALAPAPPPRTTLDPRVKQARRMLRSHAGSPNPLGSIAAALSLSPSRLTHLFSAELGLPPRRYLLWLRLLDAVAELARGASISDAACTAGFADAPHLTRTFRRMLGFTPAAARHVAFLPDTPAPGTALSGNPHSRFVQDAVARSR
jgi:AraC-like DNA-binding protein